MRRLFVICAVVVLALIGAVAFAWPPVLWALVVVGPLVALGMADMLQKHHAVLRNFPIIGHGRYLMEMIRPEINQYFVESNNDGRPFSRHDRSIVYQRAKGVLDTMPFGTQYDVYAPGYEWINHSLSPVTPDQEDARVMVGATTCRQPYSASIFNVSAMSYGSLSKNAILALNGGARLGGFAHNTGEGGLSPHHLAPGGDLIWQIGTGYFGCRNHDGSFNLEKFTQRAMLPNVKMIEIKLSQGAKPGHGGILPAVKLTQEIIDIRDVVPGQDVISPPAHTAFSSPIGLLEFVATLRQASGGKPVGFKLCVGKRHEFFGIVKAMLETRILPDFITVDGAEGGTGAAPMEFSDSIGTPLNEGLSFVHYALVGADLRNSMRLVASGKVNTGYQIATKLALGADMCNAARAMMFALGCIQALRCNTNKCPTGITTNDPALTVGLVVKDKAPRVARYHKETVQSFFEVLGAAGFRHPSELKPWHILKRTPSGEVQNYFQIYPAIEPGALLDKHATLPANLGRPWRVSRPDRF